jgi:uncharacterized protein (TIGR02444 family)
MSETGEPEAEAFWQFSLGFYASPGVAPALIALQDREGLDVNLALFALWVGISGRGRLDRDALEAADRAVRTIRTEVVEPLRSLRRRLRDHPDEDVQRLRDGVKTLELNAEKLMQTRLARLAGNRRTNAPLERRIADAHANFALYLGPEAVRGDEARIIREALAAFARGE